MRTRANVADVVSCILCYRWDEEKVRAKFGERKFITVEDVFSCRSIKWYDKIWVIGMVFFENYPFRCFPYLSQYSPSLNPYYHSFQPLTNQKRQKLFKRIKLQAKESGLM